MWNFRVLFIRLSEDVSCVWRQTGAIFSNDCEHVENYAGAERSKITDKELQAFTEELLKKDVNNAAQHIQINYQGHTKSSSTSDEAPQPLIVIRSQALQIPTISKLRLLYDNYIRDAGINEYVTPAERAEENSLLEAFMATPVMKHTMNFLSNKDLMYVNRSINTIATV
ncbi:hypothetical protein ANN_17742 [Periplaneta americana]|uniref:EndoU domain-containing protein n=1 Tax=Periplaneta americana TaxID=6978 RepID=A0ABQ8SVB6_PERAM|nr:hypothetical protein ANN_17742 [Periplaneta americana]